MPIRLATLSDMDEWAGLRARLWPDLSPEGHRKEAAALLARPPGEFAAFLDAPPGDAVRAFAEVALRRDFVNGCETSPVAFLEGIYVRPEARGLGVGRGLALAVQSWAREKGCRELASDALLENRDSHAFHAALGFEERERTVFFRRRL